MTSSNNAFVEFLKDRRLSQKAYSELTTLPLSFVKEFYQADTIDDDKLTLLENLYYENLSLHGKSHYSKSIVITVTVDKGGSGKTTSAVNISYSLARLGYSVLFIDFDGQQNGSTTILGAEEVKRQMPEPPGQPGILKMILEGDDARKYIVHSPYKHLDIICGTKGSSVISDYLAVRKHMAGQNNKADGNNLILRESLRGLIEEGVGDAGSKEFYDFIFIDTPPALNNPNTVKMICAASDKLLITTRMSFYDLQNIPSLLDFLEGIRSEFGTEILGILCTDVDKRYNTTRELRSFINNQYTGAAFKTEISHDAKIGESQLYQRPVGELDRNAMSSKQYMEVAKEILERCRNLEIDSDESADE